MWARTSSLHLGWTNCLFVLVLIYLLESYVRAFMCICSFSRKNPPNVHHASGKFNSNFLAYFVCTLIINSMYFKCLSNFIRRCNLWHNFWDFFFEIMAVILVLTYIRKNSTSSLHLIIYFSLSFILSKNKYQF